jgi:hypothetical protein
LKTDGRIELGFTDYQTSDKTYEIRVTEIDSNKWSVVCWYGKRGRAHNKAVKLRSVTYGQACEEASKILESKLKKGYVVEKRHGINL